MRGSVSACGSARWPATADRQGRSRLSTRVAGLASLLVVVPAIAGAQFSDVDAVLRDAVNDGKVAGVVGLALTRDGVVYERAFGKREVADDVDMTVDSIFRIASMTKAITSVAVMQLVDRGFVMLDDPAEYHVPALGNARVLTGFDADTGAPRLREPTSPVTVRHLLTHTSGFGYEIWNSDLQRLVLAGSLESLIGGTDGFLAAPLLFDPGQRWEYGINTDWLGRLVEEVSGQSLSAYLREHVFTPLGMTDTFFNVPAIKAPRLVTVHQRGPNGNLAEQPRQPPPSSTFFSGGGGLSSTGGDYAQFLHMLLNGGTLNGNRVLRADTIDVMAQNHIGDLEAGAMSTVAPPFSNDFDFFAGSIDRFGLGFLINGQRVDGGRAAGSLAWAGLYNTYFWIDRTRGVAGVILMQILPFYDGEAVDLLGRFERAVYAAVEQS